MVSSVKKGEKRKPYQDPNKPQAQPTSQLKPETYSKIYKATPAPAASSSSSSSNSSTLPNKEILAPKLQTTQVSGTTPPEEQSMFSKVRDFIVGDQPTITEEGNFNYTGQKTGQMFIGGKALGLTAEVAQAAAAKSTAKAAQKLTSGGLEKLLEIGKSTTKTTAKDVAINPKTIEAVGKIFGKVFSKKTLAIVGAWAGAVFLGKWGQAESTEPLTITMNKYLIPNAIQTGNWSLVEEAQAAREEILDLEWWEEVALWSPLSPAVGIPNKIKGAINAAKVQDKVIEDIRIQEATGETDADKWVRIKQEQAEEDRAVIDYYNDERKKLLEWEREAEVAGREEDAAFWAAESLKQREAEQADREAQAKFWLEYRKYTQKMYEESRPSNLNFGLI